MEAGYIDFGKARYTATYSGGSAQGSLKAGGVDVVGLVGLPLNDSFFVFAKAGVVAASVKSRLAASAPASLASGDATTHVVRPQLGVGALCRLSDHVDLRVDYAHVSGLGKSDKQVRQDGEDERQSVFAGHGVQLLSVRDRGPGPPLGMAI